MRIRAIKISLAAVVAILIAQWFQLDNVMSAGIIAILTSLDTRRASLERGIQYIVATIIAFIVATVAFHFLGISVWTFGIYLLFFVPIASYFRLSSTIPPISVLVTHFVIAESYSWSWQINGFLLMLIGVISANVFNLWMPGKTKELQTLVSQVEDLMAETLTMMGQRIQKVSTEEDDRLLKEQLSTVEQTLATLESESLLDYHNQLAKKDHYYLSYTKMRQDQLAILNTMAQTIEHLNLTTRANDMLAELYFQTADEFDEYNTGQSLLMRLAELYKEYHQGPLPETREEFETRALLFHLLVNFEQFLEIKQNFYNSLPSKND